MKETIADCNCTECVAHQSPALEGVIHDLCSSQGPAPCRRGRACQGSHNKASPEKDVHDADKDDDDNDFFEKKIHLHHRERVGSGEVTLASEEFSLVLNTK